MTAPKTAVAICGLHPCRRDGRMSVAGFVDDAARIGARGVDLGSFRADEDRESTETAGPRGCAVGEGDIDAAACIAAVARSGSDGFCSTEFEGGEHAKVGVEKSLRFLEDALRRARP